MLRHIQRGHLQGYLPLFNKGPKSLHSKVITSFTLQSTSFSSSKILGKDIYQESYKRKRMKTLAVPDSNPFALPFAFMKALACGLALSTVLGVMVGCNNSKFRAQLRTTFPYAALWVDLIKGEEVVEEEQKSASEGNQADESPFKTDLRAGMLEVKKE